MIRIQIETKNAAFGDDRRHLELAGILTKLADAIDRGEMPGPGCWPPKRKRDAHPLFDTNGNRVGFIWESR